MREPLDSICRAGTASFRVSNTAAALLSVSNAEVRKWLQPVARFDSSMLLQHLTAG